MKLDYGADLEGNILAKIGNCPLCQSDHSTYVLRLENPVRIRSDHFTFKFRTKCPASKCHILLEMPLPLGRTPCIWIVRDPQDAACLEAPVRTAPKS